MRKINVVGSSGSGKSTFSQQLAEVLKTRYIEMDMLYWLPDWQERDDADFFTILRQHLQGDSWVLDGNYNRTRAIKWAYADTVIWLDYSRQRTALQSVKRAVQRSVCRQELWPGTGNVESFKRAFFSKESVVRWSWQNYHRIRRRYLTAIADPEYRHLHFIQLTSPQMARDFIQQLIV